MKGCDEEVNISQQSAQSIINEMSSIIDHQFNLINADGRILASTNPARIGSFHGGAAKIVRDSLEELVVLSDDEYPGTRKGCNFPLVIDNDIVGIIGITGEYAQVYKYGQIIKKMTEILLKDNDAQERKKIDDRIRTRFLHDWIMTDQSATDPSFSHRALVQEIDISLPRRVVLLRIDPIAKYSDDAAGQQLIDTVNRFVRRALAGIPGAIFSKTTNEMICLLPDQSDEAIQQFVGRIRAEAQAQYAVNLIAGADSDHGGAPVAIHQAYQKACKALQACAEAKDKDLVFYGEITYELFLGEISEHTKQQFIRRVFKGCDEKEMREYMGLLKTLYETNGSITQTAEAHFIHKNTLQYKLNKLTQRTGYDPRAYGAIPLYYLAVLFSREEAGFPVPARAPGKRLTPTG
jgi:carbohydrate diacid regulator